MKYIFIIVAAVMFSACNAWEKVSYFQQGGVQAVFDTTVLAAYPDPVVKVGDVLLITVNTNSPEAAIPFNLPLVPVGEASKNYSIGSGANLSYGLSMQNYLVESNGEIVFPVLGRLKVANMTKNEVVETIKSAIYPLYLKEEPIILVRFVNFKISVLGEVQRPGAFFINNDKVSILDALAMASDLTIYGNRENILLIRENDDKREMVRLDLRDSDLVNSPYFYLQQNDVLYVEPNKSKSRSSLVSSAEMITISVVGTLISLTSLIINILR